MDDPSIAALLRDAANHISLERRHHGLQRAMEILHREGLGHDEHTIAIYRAVFDGEPIREQIRILVNMVSLAANRIGGEAKLCTEEDFVPAPREGFWQRSRVRVAASRGVAKLRSLSAL